MRTRWYGLSNWFAKRHKEIHNPHRQDEAPKKEDRLVVDPELDAPVQIDMTVTVCDFGRAEPAADAGKGEGDKAAKPAETKKEAK